MQICQERVKDRANHPGTAVLQPGFQVLCRDFYVGGPMGRPQLTTVSQLRIHSSVLRLVMLGLGQHKLHVSLVSCLPIGVLQMGP